MIQGQQSIYFSQRIATLRTAARAHSEVCFRHFAQCIARGKEHMEYKDYRDFDCTCQEEYIFREAEHLIDQFSLKTDAAKRVLQLMDRVEDGDGRYSEFVRRIAAEEGMQVAHLEQELEPFL